jgi:hypothetical protein
MKSQIFSTIDGWRSDVILRQHFAPCCATRGWRPELRLSFAGAQIGLFRDLSYLVAFACQVSGTVFVRD